MRSALFSPSPLPERAPIGVLSSATPPFAPSTPNDVSTPVVPSLTRPANAFDRQHVSDTLLSLGAGFLSGHNFSDGLGAAAQNLAQRNQAIRAEQRPTVTYGGPDDTFEISTYGNGDRSVRRVPEFAEAARQKQAAAKAPAYKDVMETRSRALYNISRLPPEQRTAAYADLRQNGASYGVDTTGLPDTWSDTFGSVAGGMGQSVYQSLNGDRNDKLADSRIARNDAMTVQGDARLQQGAQRLAQSVTRLSSPPASVLRSPRSSYATPQSRADFNALPIGTSFMAPDGKIRIKQ